MLHISKAWPTIQRVPTMWAKMEILFLTSVPTVRAPVWQKNLRRLTGGLEVQKRREGSDDGDDKDGGDDDKPVEDEVRLTKKSTVLPKSKENEKNNHQARKTRKTIIKHVGKLWK